MSIMAYTIQVLITSLDSNFRQLSKGKSTLRQLKLVPDPMHRSCTVATSIEIPSERSAVAAAGARILHPLAME